MFKRLLVFVVSMVCTVLLDLRYGLNWDMCFALSSAVCFYILGLSVYLQTLIAFKPEKDKLSTFVLLTSRFVLCYGAVAICCYAISALVSIFVSLPFWAIARCIACLVIVFVDFKVAFERKQPNYTEYIIATIDKRPVQGKKALINTPQGTLVVDTTGLTEKEFEKFYNDVKSSYEA